MNVLYFLAYPYRMAGANRSLLELVANLPQEVTPIVVVCDEGAVAECYRAAGIEPHIVRPPTPFLAYGGRLLKGSKLDKARALASIGRYTVRLSRFLRVHQIDIVHINEIRGNVLAAPAAKLCRRPIVQHLRGEFPLGRSIRTVFELTSDRIVTVSDGVQKTLSTHGRRKAVTVYNGIRVTAPPRRPMPYLEALRQAGVRIVACSASVVPFKGHHHLVDAIALLNGRGWRHKLLVVAMGEFVTGYESYHDWVGARIAERGVDNLIFVGWQPDPLVFYHHADISVLPSVSAETLEFGGSRHEVRGGEGFPRAHLEAMACALPIVGTGIAGVPEQVVDGVTGFVVPPGDPGALAEALERLLRDPDEAARMGARGLLRVEEHFSTASYVGGVMRVYGTCPPRDHPEPRRARGSGSGST